jgi:hypothetical protein
MLREVENMMIAAMKDDTHRQSRVVRSYGRGVLSWCTAARRTGNPELAKFVAEAVATWLPTEETLTAVPPRARDNNRGRGPGCKLCSADQESAAHALGYCSGSWPLQARAESIRAAVQLLIHWGVVVAAASQQSVGVSAWFDPSGRTRLEVCAAIPCAVLDGLKSLNPVDGFLGFHPAQVDKLLGWTWCGDKWERCSLSEAQGRKLKLQASLQIGALRVWQARCLAVAAWWVSQEGAASRTAMVNGLITDAQAGGRDPGTPTCEIRTAAPGDTGYKNPWSCSPPAPDERRALRLQCLLCTRPLGPPLLGTPPGRTTARVGWGCRCTAKACATLPGRAVRLPRSGQEGDRGTRPGPLARIPHPSGPGRPSDGRRTARPGHLDSGLGGFTAPAQGRRPGHGQVAVVLIPRSLAPTPGISVTNPAVALTRYSKLTPGG